MREFLPILQRNSIILFPVRAIQTDVCHVSENTVDTGLSHLTLFKSVNLRKQCYTQNSSK